MTVKELKKKLEQFQDDALVLVQGYEGGVSDIGAISASKVKLNFFDEDWNGPHEEDPNVETSAVLLMRKANTNSKQ